MSYLKTLKGSRETICLFFSWSLFLCTPEISWGQYSRDLTLNSSNTHIELEYSDLSDPSVAELKFDYLNGIGAEYGVSSLDLSIALNFPLAQGAEVNYLTTVGTLGASQPGANISAKLNSARNVIMIKVDLTQPERLPGNTFFFLEIENNGTAIDLQNLIGLPGGIAQIDIVNPGKQSVEETSIHDHSASISELSIYPVPAREHLNLTSHSGLEKVELYNSYGKLVKQYFGTKTRNLVLNTSDLIDGRYFLKTVNSEGRATRKTILVKH